jgi:hypothetical protein
VVKAVLGNYHSTALRLGTTIGPRTKAAEDKIGEECSFRVNFLPLCNGGDSAVSGAFCELEWHMEDGSF